jgi:uncharacterized protein
MKDQEGGGIPRIVTEDESSLTEVSLPLPEKPPESFPPWSGLDFLLLTLAVIGCVLFFQFAGAGVALLLPAFKGQKITELAQSTKLNVTIQSVAYVVVLLLMRRLLRHHGVGLLRGIRWNWPGQNAILYPAFGVAIALTIAGFTVLLHRYIPSNLPIEKMFRTSGDAWFLVVFGLTIAPLLEEFYFRGFLYPTLARGAGVAVATMLTVLLFVGIHAAQLASAWVPLLMLTFASLCFTLIRVKTNSVSAALLTHIGYNGMLFLTMFIQTSGFRQLDKLPK